MADKPLDHAKLQQFVEAALSNPQHPVYRLGLTHSPILQNYAVNVSLMASLKPEDWFAQYPKYTEQLTEVMRLCEAEGPDTVDEISTLKAQIAALDARIAKLSKPDADATRPAPETSEPPADDASDSG